MKFRTLERRLKKVVAFPDNVVAWFVEGHVSDANYTIVPLDDGTFTLYRPTGRGAYYPAVDSSGAQLYFATEDEVCQFVWEKSTAPSTAPASPIRLLPEEAAAQRADVLRSLGLAHDPYRKPE